MAASSGLTRQKISTTISLEAFSYLQQLIDNKEARNLAEAIDIAVQRLLVFENRERLANDTTAYYMNMTDEEATQERNLEAALSQSATGIDFDREP